MVGLSKEQKLINSTVNVVASIGLDGATTKTICTDAKLNEGYLYRAFNNKDHLLLQSYLQSSDRLMNLIVSEIDKQEKYAQSKSLKEKSKAVVYKGWEYLTDNPNVCKFLVYYYQSPQFTKHVLPEHNKWVEFILDKLNLERHTKKEYARTILYILFNTVFSMAKQVADGRLPNNQETEEIVFESIFIFISACYNGN